MYTLGGLNVIVHFLLPRFLAYLFRQFYHHYHLMTAAIYMYTQYPIHTPPNLLSTYKYTACIELYMRAGPADNSCHYLFTEILHPCTYSACLD